MGHVSGFFKDLFKWAGQWVDGTDCPFSPISVIDIEDKAQRKKRLHEAIFGDSDSEHCIRFVCRASPVPSR